MEERRYKGKLAELGYDTTLVGAAFFCDIVDDVCKKVAEENVTDEAILKTFIPSYCLEYGHFYYEVGLNKFNSEMKKFVASKKITDKNKALNAEVFGKANNLALSTSEEVLAFAKYLNKCNAKNNTSNKVLVMTMSN